jgi:hypothetical protein
VQTPATGGDPDATGSTNATFMTLPATDITLIPVQPIANLSSVFAGGPGALHIYGLNTPYQMYL